MTSTEKSTVATHTSTTTSSQVQRGVKYVYNLPAEAQLQIALPIIANAGAGIAIGAATGSIVGLVYPPVAPVSTKLGAALGGLIGAAWEINTQVRSISMSHMYARWTEQDCAKEVYPIFLKYLPERCERFLCPIDKGLIRVPTITTCRHTFEAQQILAHVMSGEGHIKRCPLGCRDLSKQDLQYDMTYHKQIMTELLPILNRLNSGDSGAPIVAYRNQVVKSRGDAFRCVTEGDVNKAMGGGISEREFMQTMKVAYNQFKLD